MGQRDNGTIAGVEIPTCDPKDIKWADQIEIPVISVDRARIAGKA